MRCESGHVGPDPHVPLRPGTVNTIASNYGSGLLFFKTRTRISRWTGTYPNFVFLAHKKLPNDRIRVQCLNPDLPG
jgi:hypothetical protein